MRVRIHIDRLVLDGFPLTAGQGRLVQAAVERELSRLIAGSQESGSGTRYQMEQDARQQHSGHRSLPALIQQGGSVPAASAGHFHPPSAASPSQLGSHIARSVYGRMGSQK